MKKLVHSLIFFICLTTLAQNKISVGNSESDYLKIINIYNTNSETVVVLSIYPTTETTYTLHAPSDPSPFVLSDQKGNRYALKRQVGWNGPNENGFGPLNLSLYKEKEFKVYFNKVEDIEDIYSIFEIGCEAGCWNFYDIKIEKSEYYIHSDNFSIDYDDTWVDYDVMENDVKGMRIHSKFTIRNMEGKLCNIRIRVLDTKNEFLNSTDNSSKYANYLGLIELNNSIRPGYENAVYSDLDTFLPYKLFDLESGQFYLKLDIDLTSSQDELIKHLEIKNFKFTR